MGFRKNLNSAQKTCLGSSGKIIHQTEMIHPGARVGIALSGGVDSWVMTQTLILRQKILPFDFEMMILHINPGFDPGNHHPLEKWLDNNQMASHIEITNIGPEAHNPDSTKSPCFICSWGRRKILFNLCKKYNLTHLALGHNSEDLAATFFLNLTHGGRVSSISPIESFFRGKLMVIRPMFLAEKKIIRNAARRWNLPVWKNPCPSAATSKRAQMEEMINSIYTQGRGYRRNILNALQRWQLDLCRKFK